MLSKKEGIDQKSILVIKYHIWPRTPHGKVTKTQENVIYKGAKKPALSQQVTIGLQSTGKKSCNEQARKHDKHET